MLEKPIHVEPGASLAAHDLEPPYANAADLAEADGALNGFFNGQGIV